MGSSDIVNYAIRPNKAVERQVVFDVLDKLTAVIPLANHRFIGLGAPWFVDFVLAHKRLNIQDMISIERDGVAASRARFNKPYSCVEVIEGDSESVLPKIDLGRKGTFAWLDYDTSLDGPVLADLSILCERAVTGSVIVVTLNADKARIPSQDVNGEKFSDWEARLRSVAGDLVPLKLERRDMQKAGYSALLTSMLFRHMCRQIRKAGREREGIVRVLDIRYQDGAPMATIGAVLCERKSKATIENSIRESGFEAPGGQKRQMEIRIPPLTLKEKSTLDQLLPRIEAPTESDVAELGFRLRKRQIEAYHRFYRHYPTFAEVSV